MAAAGGYIKDSVWNRLKTLQLKIMRSLKSNAKYMSLESIFSLQGYFTSIGDFIHTMFFVCFGVGVGYTIISFLLGHLLHFAHMDANSDGFDTSADGIDGFDTSVDGIDGIDGFDTSADGVDGFDTSADGVDHDIGGHTISPLKPVVIAAFFTVFGGVGLIFFGQVSLLLAFTIALSTGLLVAYVLYKFVVVPLYRAQNTSVVEKQSLVGHTAKVSETIPQGKYGKITYFVNGNTYTAPAKSENGEPIARNKEVEISHIDKNTYYVVAKE